jgi:hypothetical protein
MYIPGMRTPFAAPLPDDVKVYTLEGLNDEPRVPYMGKMKYLHSVSELAMIGQTPKGCPRKWALFYLAKLAKIPNEALIDGILLHACLHDWFVMDRSGRRQEWILKWMISAKGPTGKELSWYARLAQAILRHVPESERAVGLTEETYFYEIPELDTALYIKPDWLVLTLRRFRDWKSTAAQTKKSPWVLQEPEWWPRGEMPADRFSITNNIQSRVYAHGLMARFDWGDINASWVYGSKKFTGTSQIKTWPCNARFERDETRRWVERNVWPTIEWMNRVKDAFSSGALDSPMLIPHSSRACENVGKFCDAFSTCKLWKSPIPLSAVVLPVIPN